MTEPYFVDDPAGDDERDEPAQFQVFNPDRTVGVAADRNGVVTGLHIDAEAGYRREHWLAEEIVRVAQLAHFRSLVALRADMRARGTAAHIIDDFELPTEADYIAMEAQLFDSTP